MPLTAMRDTDKPGKHHNAGVAVQPCVNEAIAPAGVELKLDGGTPRYLLTNPVKGLSNRDALMVVGT
jgi:hypothetical protein